MGTRQLVLISITNRIVFCSQIKCLTLQMFTFSIIMNVMLNKYSQRVNAII